MNEFDESHSQEAADRPPVSTASATSKTTGRRWSRVVITIAVAVLLCFGAGLGGSMVFQALNRGTEQVTQRLTPDSDGNKIVTQEEENIADVVEKVGPSVVSIVTKSQTASVYGVLEEAGAGTGIIVGKDGYILTNKHVVSGSDTVGVILADGTNYPEVKVLGVDPLNDIAFLKIPNVSDLPAAELGDSTSIHVGQKVVAIGNSLGQYQNTVTSGIISGTGRPISAQSGESVENLTDLIQTDAAINPGNSGGPLLNLQGQVVGVNTAIVEDAQGIGFSIPINATKGTLKGVLTGGPVQRAYLGISYIPITADVAKHYGLSVKKGAYVFSPTGQPAVQGGGPADKGGIKEKDIITKIGNIEVGDRGGVASLVAEYAPGDTIEITVLRNGNTTIIKVTLSVYKA